MKDRNKNGEQCFSHQTGKPVAAISVSGPVFQMAKKFVQDVVKKEVMAAAEISERLGFKE
jgi:DNA-binding IclR family transcriptional regulator